tara:strand:- start:2062 stop:2331 length:270 start_codon:yes stop_codon:yes gene_type:complete
MKTITVQLTDTQWSALQYIAEDPEDWFVSWAQTRADSAAKDIVSLYTDTKVQLNQPITAIGTDAIVEAAYGEQIIKTVADANAIDPKLE